MEKKFELTDETRELDGHTLHKIRAVRDFDDVKKGDLGGWVEKESNLAHEGDCWVSDNAKVCDNAKVYDNAKVCSHALVCGDAKVCGNAMVYGDALVYDHAWVYGDAKVCGNAWVYGHACISNGTITKFEDYACLHNFWSSGRSITYNFTSDTWITGCFSGTTEELLKKAYGDNEAKGECFEKLVNFIQGMKN